MILSAAGMIFLYENRNIDDCCVYWFRDKNTGKSGVIENP
jgi:hypothetical protein